MHHFVFVICFTMCFSIASFQNTKQFRNLNGKINILRKMLVREVDELKFEILDLRTELTIEKERTSSLESIINDTMEETGSFTFTGPIDSEKVRNVNLAVVGHTEDIAKLSKTLFDIKEQQNALVSSVKRLQDISSEIVDDKTAVEELSEQVKIIDTKIKAVTNEITRVGDTCNDKYNDLHNMTTTTDKSNQYFKAQLLSAFNDEKVSRKRIEDELLTKISKLVPNATIIQKSIIGTVTATVIKVSTKIKVDLNQTITEFMSVRQDMADMELRMDLLNNTVTTLANTSDKCCSKEIKSLVQTTSTATTIPSSTLSDTTPLSLTTIATTPVPNIQPIYGPALEKAIKIGSRVVRGKHWTWGSQDGTPPGPGTVIRLDKTTKQVYVKWDSGMTVNYWNGAGRYDLYLLKV